MSRNSAVVGLLGLVLLATGCSAASEPSSTVTPDAIPSESGGVPATPPPSPTTTPGPTPSDEAPLPYAILGPDGTPAERAESPEGLVGSGCTPGSADTLPDGVWFGYVVEWGGSWIDFDLACYWGSDSSQTEQECKDEPSCVYAVTNTASTVRRMPVEQGSAVWDVYGFFDGELWGYSVSYGDLDLALLNENTDLEQACTIPYPSDTEDNLLMIQWALCRPEVWIYVNDGVVTEFEKLFNP